MRYIVIDHNAKKAWPYRNRDNAESQLRLIIAGEIENGLDIGEDLDQIDYSNLQTISPSQFIIPEGPQGVWVGFDTAGRESTGGPYPESEQNMRWDGHLVFNTTQEEDGTPVDGKQIEWKTE